MTKLDIGYEFIEKLELLGYKAYFVGGSSRDILLNNELKDIDISSNIPLEIIKSNFNYIENKNREKYFSYQILYKDSIIDLTNFRIDINDKIRQTTCILTNELFFDAKRRDFTINQIYLNKKEKIDYFNGSSDIKNKIIKSILNPDIRFREDPIRMLRALYFKLKLGFSIEENTFKSIKNNIQYLGYINENIVYKNIYKLINVDSKKALSLLKEIKFFKYFQIDLKILKQKNLEEKEFLNLINGS